MDAQDVHQARVRAMMSHVLDLQDRIAALAVTAPSPRQMLLRSPAVPDPALPELRVPRLMTARSLPSSIEAVLMQMGEPLTACQILLATLGSTLSCDNCALQSYDAFPQALWLVASTTC